jgi:hypothetical protein
MTAKMKEALKMVRDMSLKVDKEQVETHEFLNKVFLLLLEMDPPQEKEIVYVPRYWRDWCEPYKVWYSKDTHQSDFDKYIVVGDAPNNSHIPAMRFELKSVGDGDYISWSSSVSGDKL